MQYTFLILSLIHPMLCDLEPFIVGGAVAKIKNFPHCGFLNVMCNEEDQPGWICGSSIVNQRIMLTAAHCVIGCSGKIIMFVSVGSRHIKKGIVSAITSVAAHEKYRKNSLGNDIALLRLRTPLMLNSGIRRVALMKKPPRFSKAQVAGWGYIKDKPKKQTEIMYYVDQYILNRAKCRKLHSNMPKGTICARSKKGRGHATVGDSGSALVVRGFIQIGIVSYKMPSISKSLVVYTDTGYFYDWIKKNAKKLYCVIEQK